MRLLCNADISTSVSLICFGFSQDTAAVPQDLPYMGKFKLKSKGEKHKIKAAKQQITIEPSNLMNGEDG